MSATAMSMFVSVMKLKYNCMLNSHKIISNNISPPACKKKASLIYNAQVNSIRLFPRQQNYIILYKLKYLNVRSSCRWPILLDTCISTCLEKLTNKFGLYYVLSTNPIGMKRRQLNFSK